MSSAILLHVCFASLASPSPAVASPAASAQAQSLNGCAKSVRDQANPGACLQATSVPTPGMLFPPPHDGGLNNAAGGAHSFIGGGRDNETIGDRATIGGGQLNVADAHATVGGGTFNHALGASTIGGGSQNFANNNGAVGGGGINMATGAFATVAGGYFNTANGYFGAIGGGYGNFAGYQGAVAGGLYNNAGTRAAVGGGWANAASGEQSAIGGGGFNSATGAYSTVPGGSDNAAASDYSFAAGRRAKATHAGSFVWGDGQNLDKTSSAANQFNVYAGGGTRIFSDAGGTAGVLLAPGGGSWSSVSDRAAKENFEPVDARDALERLRALPIATWNYRTQDASVRHMGPVAQDFHALFGLGASDTTIDTIDADGVALAAIQGLGALVAEQELRIAALEAELAALREAPSPAGARPR
jgi:hypothetical protein